MHRLHNKLDTIYLQNCLDKQRLIAPSYYKADSTESNAIGTYWYVLERAESDQCLFCQFTKILGSTVDILDASPDG